MLIILILQVIRYSNSRCLAGHTAKDIVELTNDKFDNTGVSATATTTVKLQVTSSVGGMQGTGKVVSMNIYGKNQLLSQLLHRLV